MPTGRRSKKEQTLQREISRRSFIQFGAATVFSLAAGTSIAGLTACSGAKEGADAVILGKQTVVDDMGREVEIPTPENLKRVYFTSALAQIFVFTMAPELMGGVSSTIEPDKLKYLPPEMGKLPALGSMSGENGSIDREMLMDQKIQVVFSISGVALTEANRVDAVDLQESTGIPVVLVDGSLEVISNAYRLLGKCMGRASRAEELSKYLEDIYARVTEAVGDVAPEDQKSVYLAEGPLGLQTESDASQHTVIIQKAGGRVVAHIEEETAYGMTDVSLESVISWDPEIILAWSSEHQGGADEIIRTNVNWSSIRAVREGRVYTTPSLPFSWVERPPAVNRFLGLQWLANMFYPDKYDVDMLEVAKDFYKFVYQIENIEDADILEMLGNSYPPIKT
jgi:iron complex transport system substrate-binding protein